MVSSVCVILPGDFGQLLIASIAHQIWEPYCPEAERGPRNRPATWLPERFSLRTGRSGIGFSFSPYLGHESRVVTDNWSVESIVSSDLDHGFLSLRYLARRFWSITHCINRSSDLGTLLPRSGARTKKSSCDLAS